MPDKVLQEKMPHAVGSTVLKNALHVELVKKAVFSLGQLTS